MKMTVLSPALACTPPCCARAIILAHLPHTPAQRNSSAATAPSARMTSCLSPSQQLQMRTWGLVVVPGGKIKITNQERDLWAVLALDISEEQRYVTFNECFTKHYERLTKF